MPVTAAAAAVAVAVIVIVKFLLTFSRLQDSICSISRIDSSVQLFKLPVFCFVLTLCIAPLSHVTIFLGKSITAKPRRPRHHRQALWAASEALSEGGEEWCRWRPGVGVVMSGMGWPT